MPDRVPRLLWLHQNYVAPHHPGSERAATTVQGLLDRGWDVDLVTSSGGYQGEEPPTRRDLLTIDAGLHWRQLALGAHAPQERSVSYRRFFWRGLVAGLRSQPPDLIFASTPPLTQTLQSAFLAARWRVPVVLEVRDLWPACLEELGLIRSPALLAILRRLESRAYKTAAKIVLASPAFRPYFEGQGIAPADIVDAPHGAPERDVRRLRLLGESFRRRHGLGDRPIVVYAGSLNEYYAVADWLESARQLAATDPAICFVVAGGGRERKRVERAAEAGHNILYLGALPRRELDQVYGAADLGLVLLTGAPSFTGVLPGKLVDLLSCAIPIVSNIDGQVRRIVEVSRCGWVMDAGPSGIANGIRTALALPRGERRRAGEAGRSFVRRTMSAEDQVRHIAEACAAALVKGRAARKATNGSAARAIRSIYLEDRGASAVAAFDAWLSRKS